MACRPNNALGDGMAAIACSVGASARRYVHAGSRPARMCGSRSSCASLLGVSPGATDRWQVDNSNPTRSYVDHAKSGVDPIERRGPGMRGPFPLWARWNDELGQRYTLGVEEELMLLEPDGWSLAQASDSANGASRQRAFVANRRVDDLVASLADRFLAPDRRASVARDDPRKPSVPTERSGVCAAGSHTQAVPS
jgi:hypothetical protein